MKGTKGRKQRFQALKIKQQKHLQGLRAKQERIEPQKHYQAFREENERTLRELTKALKFNKTSRTGTGGITRPSLST